MQGEVRLGNQPPIQQEQMLVLLLLGLQRLVQRLPQLLMLRLLVGLLLQLGGPPIALNSG